LKQLFSVFCIIILFLIPLISQSNLTQIQVIASNNIALPINSDTEGWNMGVAGPVTGVIKNKIIVGGGANFPDAPPWLGGKKIYHDHLYVLSQKIFGRYHWKKIESNLPQAIGYSANVSTSKGLLVIGGENEIGELKTVYLIGEENGQVKILPFKNLPLPVTATSAVEIDGKIYLAGGTSGNQASKSLFCLEQINEASEWKRMPDMPLALSNAVIVSQYDGTEHCVFVLGGRFKNPNDVTTTFSSKVLKYQPSRKYWSIVGDLKSNLSVLPFAAGTGVAVKEGRILMIGGDEGTTFNKIEQFNHNIQSAEGIAKTELTNQKNELLTNHSGFSKRVLLYNVLSNECEEIALLQDFAQVTTSAFYHKKDIIIPSGEIKPGIRTPKITRMKLKF
jgi:N-acetylneuraminate epimerase